MGRPLPEGAASNDQDAATDLMAAMSPTRPLCFFCCVRSQREKYGMSEKLHAVAQPNNRPFVKAAA